MLKRVLMPRWLVMTVMLLMLVLAAPATADDWSDCHSCRLGDLGDPKAERQCSNSDLIIRGCSSLIEADIQPHVKGNFFRRRASAYSSNGDYDRAIADYSMAIRLLPEPAHERARAYSGRAWVRFSKGSYDLAIIDASKAIRIAPFHTPAIDTRANAYFEKGDRTNALYDFKLVLRLSSTNDPLNIVARARIAEIEEGRPPNVGPIITVRPTPPSQPSTILRPASPPSYPAPKEAGRRVFSISDGAIVEVSLLETGSQDVVMITLEGELKPGDNKSFTRAAIDAEYAIVALSSPGGDLQAGMEIGKTIRIKEFATLVPRDFSCASACALAWLAGQPRYMEPGARIGFHAPSRADDPNSRADSAGSAIVGAYLNKLGLPSRAIAYFTEKQPDEMQWLTFEDADRLGIYVKEFRP
jgi:hypothetical protein